VPCRIAWAELSSIIPHVRFICVVIGQAYPDFWILGWTWWIERERVSERGRAR
jgi:hypothetical protein